MSRVFERPGADRGFLLTRSGVGRVGVQEEIGTAAGLTTQGDGQLNINYHEKSNWVRAPASLRTQQGVECA